jgi:hypothetical protein
LEATWLQVKKQGKEKEYIRRNRKTGSLVESKMERRIMIRACY